MAVATARRMVYLSEDRWMVVFSIAGFQLESVHAGERISIHRNAEERLS
jgi:hypothetical protein